MTIAHEFETSPGNYEFLKMKQFCGFLFCQAVSGFKEIKKQGRERLC